MRLLRRRLEPLDAVRLRIIHETEAALYYGLHFPDRAVRIPTVEVGRARFDPVFAARFWGETLGIEETAPAAFDPSDRRCSAGVDFPLS